MKSNLTKKTLTTIAAMGIFFAASAQYKPIVTNDPMGDAGSASGVDVKNLSYMMSTDKKNVTIKVETHNAITAWDYKGFIFYIDEDMNAMNGAITPACANKSIKAERKIECMSMMGMWMNSLTVGTATATSLTGVTITMPDTKTTLITIPLDKVDGNADGKFNLLVGAMNAGTTTDIDDLPNTGFSSVYALGGAAAVAQVGAEESAIKVYPNPASQAINFSSKDAVNGSINVYDMMGKTISSVRINGAVTTLQTSNLPAGVYLYSVVNAEGALLQKGNFNIAR